MVLKTNMEESLKEIKSQISVMMRIVKSQIDKSYDAFMSQDRKLASEVIHIEERINALELSIERDCENHLALYSPVAMDLRYVIAALHITTQLERIGDHAKGIAQYVKNKKIKKPYKKDLLKQIRFKEMFEIASSMVDDAIYSFLNEDTTLARWVFGKDMTLNDINEQTAEIIAEFTLKKPEKIDIYLYLFSTMKKLERVGDLAKNIAEETIFYVDANVVKHQSTKDRLNIENNPE